ncbi:hypothetical protein EPI10_033582 [Gossypium australe]|uniref:Uncharacterized protein n=1 Tax=Gossypium australe TaxID=47621 RepID=A0A5B6XAY5_9ROSI|nr:hypothetical protein EPI10_033582 [Gossypium australe]
MHCKSSLEHPLSPQEPPQQSSRTLLRHCQPRKRRAPPEPGANSDYKLPIPCKTLCISSLQHPATPSQMDSRCKARVTYWPHQEPHVLNHRHH